MNYRVMDSVWFEDIGIVRIRPEVGVDKFYIGTYTLDETQYESEQRIAKTGMPVPKNLLVYFFTREIE